MVKLSSDPRVSSNGRRVILLRAGEWPDMPGVCCWRFSVREAFGALGLPVEEIGSREVLADQRDDEETSTTSRLRAAGLVIAETLEAAQLARRNGVPKHRAWALVLPPEPAHLGSPREGDDRTSHLVQIVGGILTDSELARESVEQEARHSRPLVKVFPPLATDRVCPSCASSDVDLAVAKDPPTPAALLSTWRTMIQAERSGDPASTESSFVSARLFGLADRWGPERSRWGNGEAQPAQSQQSEVAPDWSAEAQDRSARAVWEATKPTIPSKTRFPRKVLVSGYNFKFVTELADRLGRRDDLGVTLDEWPRASKPSDNTIRRLESADSIFAEWARANAVWFSRNKKTYQFLVVRVHRFELDVHHPTEILVDNVDAFVYIAPLFGRRLRDELGWPVEKLVYIPNFLDVSWFSRSKLTGARFGIGIVGVESARKRFDLALDLLTEVRREDPRFTLHVRSVLPWNNPRRWQEDDEREYFQWCLARIQHEPLLRGAVIFDLPGRDMARWYRQVGHILSTSDEEGSHMAPAEGMASGAVPVIRPWPGATELYGSDWIHASTKDAAATVLQNADPDTWAERSARAQAEVKRSHNPEAVLNAWADLIHGDLEGAKTYFDQQLRPASTAASFVQASTHQGAKVRVSEAEVARTSDVHGALQGSAGSATVMIPVEKSTVEANIDKARSILDADGPKSSGAAAAEAAKASRILRLREAEALIHEVLHDEPTEEAIVLDAEIASRLRDWDIAIVRWNRVLREAPEYRNQAHYNLAVAYRSVHSFYRAHHALGRAKGRAMRSKVERERERLAESEAQAAAKVVGNRAVESLIQDQSRDMVSSLINAALQLSGENRTASECVESVTATLAEERKLVGGWRRRSLRLNSRAARAEGAPSNAATAFFCGFGWSGSGALYDYFCRSPETVEPFGRAESSLFGRAGAGGVLDESAERPENLRSPILRLIYHTVFGIGGGPSVEPGRARSRTILRFYEGDERLRRTVTRACIQLYRDAVLTAKRSNPDRIENAIRAFLDTLVYAHVRPGQVGVFSNAIHASRVDLTRLISNSSAFVVLRDPRDQYVARVYESPRTVSCDWFIKDLKSKYDKYKAAAKQLNDDVHEVQFEEFVTSSEERASIARALGVSLPVGGNGYRPEDSVKNIGIHRSFPNVSEIQKIERELSEWLYGPRSAQ